MYSGEFTGIPIEFVPNKSFLKGEIDIFIYN